MIGIIDYGLGNVKAFANIYRELDLPFVIATSAADLHNVSHVILPGVGAFDQAMRRLESSGMRGVLDRLVMERKVSTLGVCVGMQILMRSSEEGVRPGLGWIDGTVVRFRKPHADRRVRVPHMGWNEVSLRQQHGLLAGLQDDPRFYFLHSYLAVCENDSDVLATAQHGGEFSCAVGRANVLGVQFHPEKSHRYGIQLLKNFAGL